MARFAELNPVEGDNPYRAPKVIMVPPEAFADDWAGKLSEPVEMGLRITADMDTETARAEAAKRALLFHSELDSEGAVACYNDALLRWLIARGTCQPDDYRQPYFRAAEDLVHIALTTEGVKMLAFELDVFTTETSPLCPPATDEELVDLSAILLEEKPFDGMAEVEERAARRLATRLLEMFGGARVRAAGDAVDE